MADTLVSQTIAKFSKKSSSIKTRKALQVLQVSATDSALLVASPGMMRQKEKKDLKPSENLIKEARGEENGSKEHLLRRSKRKNVPQQNEGKGVQKDNPTKSLKKKGPKAFKAKAAKSKSVSVISNQSSLDSFVSVKSVDITSKSTDVASKSVDVSIPIKKEEVSEHSIFQDSSIDNTIRPNDYTNMRVVRSTSDETNMLTSDEPGTAYWQMLAEERRSALEIALIENEQLRIELEVLETENNQLKNVLHDLESVVEVINASLA